MWVLKRDCTYTYMHICIYMHVYVWSWLVMVMVMGPKGSAPQHLGRAPRPGTRFDASCLKLIFPTLRWAPHPPVGCGSKPRPPKQEKFVPSVVRAKERFASQASNTSTLLLNPRDEASMHCGIFTPMGGSSDKFNPVLVRSLFDLRHPFEHPSPS